MAVEMLGTLVEIVQSHAKDKVFHFYRLLFHNLSDSSVDEPLAEVNAERYGLLPLCF